MSKVLGILGGMGPSATADLFKKIIDLTPAKCDQDHIHIIIDNYPQIPDRTGCIIDGKQSPVPFMIEAAIRLEKAGADAIIMPCNTAHYFINDVQKEVKIPFISIVESAINAIKLNYPSAKTVLPIATTGTKKSAVYDSKLIESGYIVPEISAELQNNIMHCIYQGVKEGKTKEVVPLFQKTVDELEKLNIDVFIAACTEIPLLTPFITTKTPIIDATLELAKAGVKFAKG